MAANTSGLLPHLLEKDIWVVWSLRHLGVKRLRTFTPAPFASLFALGEGWDEGGETTYSINIKRSLDAAKRNPGTPNDSRIPFHSIRATLLGHSVNSSTQQ